MAFHLGIVQICIGAVSVFLGYMTQVAFTKIKIHRVNREKHPRGASAEMS